MWICKTYLCLQLQYTWPIPRNIVLVLIFFTNGNSRNGIFFAARKCNRKVGRKAKKKKQAKTNKQTSPYTGNIISPSISLEDAQDFMS